MLLDGAADEGDERLQPSRFKRAVTADVIDAVRIADSSKNAIRFRWA
jgi:hypothetical protein